MSLCLGFRGVLGFTILGLARTFRALRGLWDFIGLRLEVGSEFLFDSIFPDVPRVCHRCPQKHRSTIGTAIITKTIVGIPCYSYNTIYPKTLF